jgi:hypothetical protein
MITERMGLICDKIMLILNKKGEPVDVFSVFGYGFHADRSSDPAFGKQQVGAGIVHAVRTTMK